MHFLPMIVRCIEKFGKFQEMVNTYARSNEKNKIQAILT